MVVVTKLFNITINDFDGKISVRKIRLCVGTELVVNGMQCKSKWLGFKFCEIIVNITGSKMQQPHDFPVVSTDFLISHNNPATSRYNLNMPVFSHWQFCLTSNSDFLEEVLRINPFMQ